MSKKAKSSAAPAAAAGPASVPAEAPAPRPIAAPAKGTGPKPATQTAEAGTPADTIPSEADISDHFLAELEGSLPTEIDGVAPKRAPARDAAADQPGDSDGENQEAPADDDANESTDELPAAAEDESGAPGQESTNDTNDTDDEDEEPEEDEDLAALAQMDEEQLESHAADRRWPDSYLKRVKKFTRQLRAAEAESRRLREQLDAEGSPDNPKPESRNADLASRPGALSSRETRLSADIAQHEDWLDRIEAVEPGGSLQVGDQTFGPEQLRKARRKLETNLAALTVELTSSRRERAEQVRAGEAEAISRHPWLKDRSNPDTALIQAAIHQYPVLGEIPNVRALLADALAYRRLREKAKAKNGTHGTDGTHETNGHAESQPGTRNAKPGTAARGPARPAAAPLPASRRGPDLNGRLGKVMETGSRKDAESLVMDLVEK
jgi:hypothetical protein